MNASRYRWWFAGVLALASALRCAEALRRPLDVDEGLSLSIAVRPLADEVHFLRYALDVHPPLAFFFIHLLYVLHVPVWGMHLAMVVLGVFSVALLMAIVARWATPQAALGAGFVAACMPSLVLYDGWIRMYAPFQALTMLGWWLLSVVVAQPDARRRTAAWACWALSAAAAAYTFYLAAPTFLAQFVYAATRSVRTAIAAAIAAVVAALLWLPQLSTFLFQLHIGGGLNYGGLRTDLADALWQLPSQATIDPHVEGWPSEAAAAFTWLWAIAAFVAAWSSTRRTMLPWLALPAIVTLVASFALGKLLYVDRYYLPFVYALAAWTGVAATAWAARWRPAVAIGGGLACALAAAGTAFAFDPAFYTADWPAVVAALDARARPADLVVFEQGPGYWAFQFYQGRRHYDVWQVSTPQDIDWAIAHVDPFPRVWLIGSSLRGVDPQLRLLDHLERRYKLGYFEESVRALPSEDVEIGLFVRGR
jgi:hypothetical protein